MSRDFRLLGFFMNQFPPSTGGKFATGVVDTGGAPCLGNISANFRKNSQIALMLNSGAWGKVIHEKTLNQKNLVTLSL